MITIGLTGGIVQPELHVPQVAAVVGELLENVNAVGVDMAAVLEGVKIGSVGALPCQHDLVGITSVSFTGYLDISKTAFCSAIVFFISSSIPRKSVESFLGFTV